jgi:hypothetical protein
MLNLGEKEIAGDNSGQELILKGYLADGTML